MSGMQDEPGEEPRPPPDRAPLWVVLGCALAITLLGAAKPLVVDDAAFLQYARHIAVDPFDPYGFEVFWYDEPQPAQSVLAPPLLAYWWSLAIRLFGDAPIAWKLWLLPFALLLCGSLERVLRVVAPRGRASLLCLVALSPAVLPALNLMLDLPALSLALASVAAVLAACERTARASLGLAVLAGVIGGLALEAKYTALLPQIAVLGYAALRGRWRVAFVAGGIAASVFLAWEASMWRLYGESHFWMGTSVARVLARASAAKWAFAFACLLGCSSSIVAVLALAARGAEVRLVFAGLGIIGLAFGVVAFLPAEAIGSFAPVYPRWDRLGAEAGVYFALGVATLGLVGSLIWRELRRGAGLVAWRERPLDAFLLLWLVFEVAGFFVLSPYPAMRRVLGSHVALVLFVGRLATSGPVPSRSLRAIAASGAALGLLFAVTDVVDARTRTAAAERAFRDLDELAERYGEGRRWYVGHWGFQYYAERAGLVPAIPMRSLLQPGDWIAVADGVARQRIVLPPEATQEMHEVVAWHGWPWSTLPSLYGGYRALRPRPDALLRIRLLRVVDAIVPGLDRPPQRPGAEG